MNSGKVMAEKILINIGNTHSQLQALGKLTTVSTKQLHDMQFIIDLFNRLGLSKGTVFVASVVPKVNKALIKALPNVEFTFITWDMLTWIDFSTVDPSTIGADRLANVAQASTLKLPAMVIDLGTAITTEVISADYQFLGGSILPGRALSRKALNLHTAQLPLAELTQQLPSALGKSTIEAIQTIDLATVGGLNALISASEKEIGERLHLYATGGDAAYFCQYIDRLEQMANNFTLLGLETIANS